MRLNSSLCVLCRGRGFCSLTYCPIIARARATFRLKEASLSPVVEGSTPPSVFVGRVGYPNIRVGPASPPVLGDTTLFDYPEKWKDLRIEDILEYRWSLITGFKVFNVREPTHKVLDEVRLLALSSKPVDVQMVLEKRPKPIITFSEYEPPQGPRAPLTGLKILGNPTIPRPLERAHYDTDLRASEAIIYLYSAGIPVSHIQKAFSLGSFGLGKRRKLVPTRWSITAVDSTLCRYILGEVKQYQPINEPLVFETRVHDNLFVAVLLPYKWSYEWLEAWWPGSTWNPSGLQVSIEGDYESYFGRSTYPSIGGCYYASMLATLEYLKFIKRQATAILMREIYPGFNLPIGVWFVRESCREMFKRGPALRPSNLKEICEFLDKHTRLGCSKWFSSSKLLGRVATTKHLEEFIKRS